MIAITQTIEKGEITRYSNNILVYFIFVSMFITGSTDRIVFCTDEEVITVSHFRTRSRVTSH